MAVAEFFTQTVTLVRTTADDRDVIGGATPGTTTTTEVNGWLDPKSGSEDMADRNTQIGDWTLYLPIGTDVIGWDRVTFQGRTFDIIAPPRPFVAPRGGDGADHLEVDLREVE